MLPDFYVSTLKQQITYYRGMLEPLEAGQMHLRQKMVDGLWIDRTQAEIVKLKRYISELETILLDRKA